MIPQGQGGSNPPVQDYNQALAFIAATTGDANTICDFRGVHETDRSVAGRKRRGTLQEHWLELSQMNNEGFGVYMTINETDGQGADNVNVMGVRAQFIDLDNIDAQQMFTEACHMEPKPSFYVQSSPGKFHVYWKSAPHRDTAKFTTVQRKLITKFHSDPTIIDPARIMRLPGTLHMKNPAAPTLVQCYALGGPVTSTEALDLALWNVSPSELGAGGIGRIPIGEGDRAPSTDAAIEMLQRIDVRQLTDRNEWVAVTGAFMQSVDPNDWQRAFQVYMAWNEPYPGNDVNANIKTWNDLTEHGTTVKGWNRLHREATSLTPQQARLLTGGGARHPGTPTAPVSQSSAPQAAPAPDASVFGPILDPAECAAWFDGCVLIASENKIITPKGMRYSPERLNSAFGGKAFIITQDGKTTDEPWKAATRSQLWTVPKVEFTCFRPDLKTGDITTDELDRKYVNTYIPAKIETLEGDASPFLRHLEKLFPDTNDRETLLDFLAHNVKYPGHKIAWAPLIQSGEGGGKNAIKKALQYAVGRTYFYEPKARDLVESGSKFNGWMENKVFFLVDEVRTDENREMVEILKPFITEKRLEIQGKGADQRMGDTPGNWLFFSNWKDAIPITANTRRHAIYYSAIQTPDDLQSAGMTKAYFESLYNWLGDDENGGHYYGLRIVAHYLMQRQIGRGELPERAPRTTSFTEALTQSRGPLEQTIAEAIECERVGFKRGWVSTKAVQDLLRDVGKRVPATNTMAAALKNLGYSKIGRVRSGQYRDSYVWNTDPNENVANFEPAQLFSNMG